MEVKKQISGAAMIRVIASWHIDIDIDHDKLSDDNKYNQIGSQLIGAHRPFPAHQRSLHKNVCANIASTMHMQP